MPVGHLPPDSTATRRPSVPSPLGAGDMSLDLYTRRTLSPETPRCPWALGSLQARPGNAAVLGEGRAGQRAGGCPFLGKKGSENARRKRLPMPQCHKCPRHGRWPWGQRVRAAPPSRPALSRPDPGHTRRPLAGLPRRTGQVSRGRTPIMPPQASVSPARRGRWAERGDQCLRERERGVPSAPGGQR